jgi:O-methyltransferase domain/Dimerisation domain
MSTATANTTETTPQDKAAEQLFQLAMGYMGSAALQTAVKLRVADQLASGPRLVADIARAVGANEDALYRILRALTVFGVFEEVDDRRFALTPAAEMLRSDKPGLYPMALWITSPFHFRAYAELIHSARTAQPAVEQVVGMPAFEYLAKDRELSEIFNNAMTAFSAMVVPAALEAYDFSGIDTLVDVAGGHGMLLASILQKFPNTRGILADVDHVIAGAGPRLQAMGVADRVETRVVDFFEAVPEGGDAYIMKHIIHDWDDDRAAIILGNIRKALSRRQDGKVLLLEAVVAPRNQPDPAKLVDLEMMVMPGGRERTAAEFETLFTRSGFRMTRVVPTKSPLSVIEAVVRS